MDKKQVEDLGGNFLRIKRKDVIPPRRQMNRLRSLRIARGWMQEELAQRLGCSASKINMTEMGKRGMTEDLAVAAARVFKVSVDYFLCQTNDPKQYRPAATEDDTVDLAKITAHWKRVGFPGVDD